jgi:arylsulfatase A-like enzyme
MFLILRKTDGFGSGSARGSASSAYAPWLPLALLLAGLLVLQPGCAVVEHAAAPPRSPRQPNIIIVFADDQGYADLGILGHDPDVRTPHLDRLARDGVLFTRGYVTAPQCVPSRAGLIAGRHQNTFGLDDNLRGPLPHDEYTIAERLRDAGYVTGMVGKWHLELGYGDQVKPQFLTDFLPHQHGFEEYFCGYMERYHASHDLAGKPLPNPPRIVIDRRYRIDIQTDAALSFLDRRKTSNRPFFLYLAYYAPHSPMEEPPHYMARLAHVQERERRRGLASILAMDDGIGRIRKKLADMGVADNTLIFYLSDNGAPLRDGAYIGSLNTPLTGEKGMLTDGGQRIPFIATWPGTIRPGRVFEEAVWTLDATATALAVAKAPLDDRIEGVNLMPWMAGQRTGPVHDALCWRWRSQAAILSGYWKFVRLGNERRYLFDMRNIGQETAADNKIGQYPEIAAQLERKLEETAGTWKRGGLPDREVAADKLFYDLHVERTLPPPRLGNGKSGEFIPWDASRPGPTNSSTEYTPKG